MVGSRQKRPLDPPTYRTPAVGLPTSPYAEYLARTAKSNARRSTDRDN